MNVLKNLMGHFRDDEPIADQEREVKRHFNMIKEHTGVEPPILPACDELPRASGPFGLCVTNPIPVNGPRGELLYLNRLRNSPGTGFLYHRLGSTGCDLFPVPIDMYELVSTDASRWMTLYFSMYHPYRTLHTPAGLSMVSYRSASEMERILQSMKGFNSTGRVENFPYGLVEVVAKDPELMSMGPEYAAAMARHLQELLDRRAGQWVRPRN